jgi:phosphoribosylaminoimidazolecarboxamide formyltransferase / IMP cyclohydrolase
MAELKQMYRTVMDDHFPERMIIQLGNQILVYQKKSWKIPDEKTGEFIEKGLRYGENPGQEAALYELTRGNLSLGGCEFIGPGKGLVSAIAEEEMLQSGKHPGKINFTDADNALNILKYLMDRPAAAIMKHNNPSGVAYGRTLVEAYDRANLADRIAAFGGCLAVNRPMDRATAEMVRENYLEVVVAPEYEEGTVDILKKRTNLRIVRVPRIDRLAEYRNLRFVDFKSLSDGGIIIQQSSLNAIKTPKDFQKATATYKGKVYTIQREPTEKEYADMMFGWAVEQGVTSNSVLYVKDGCTVGIGTGEQDRVGVAEIAVFKAYTKYADTLCFQEYKIPYKTLETEIVQGKRDRAAKEEIDQKTKKACGGIKGSVMISDAFFPFRDGVDAGIQQGVTGIVHPGGSDRDFESIEACNEARPQVAMVFTGQRAFKH